MKTNPCLVSYAWFCRPAPPSSASFFSAPICATGPSTQQHGAPDAEQALGRRPLNASCDSSPAVVFACRACCSRGRAVDGWPKLAFRPCCSNFWRCSDTAFVRNGCVVAVLKYSPATRTCSGPPHGSIDREFWEYFDLVSGPCVLCARLVIDCVELLMVTGWDFTATRMLTAVMV